MTATSGRHITFFELAFRLGSGGCAVRDKVGPFITD